MRQRPRWIAAAGLIAMLMLWPSSGRAVREKSTLPDWTEETDAGDVVTRQLQEQLLDMGFYTGPLDGRSNTPLIRAIKAYQEHIDRPAGKRTDQRRPAHAHENPVPGGHYAHQPRNRAPENNTNCPGSAEKNDKTRDLLDRANIDNIAAARYRSVALGPIAVAFTKRMI